MADRDPKVLAMVERELKKDPKVSGDVLQETARSINKEEAELSGRSFNARYPLPVRKKLSGRTGRRKKGAAKKGRAVSSGISSDHALALGSLIEKHIRDAKATLDVTLDAALKKAGKSGRVSEFETIHQALIKAGQTIGKV